MNYIKQLNEFYCSLDYKPLTVNAIAVYYILLQIANNAGWIDQIRVANSVILNKCNISKKQLINARNNLVNQGYIEYEKGNCKITAPQYKIIQLYKKDDEGTNKGTNRGTNEGTNKGTINKQNETKQNKKKSKEKEFIPPTLEEVEAYVSKAKLKVSAKTFLDYFTAGNWIDSKGNKVKNWKQKILTWDNFQMR